MKLIVLATLALIAWLIAIWLIKEVPVKKSEEVNFLEECLRA
jgi:hypothetical protein